MKKFSTKKGFTLIDVILSIGIIVLLFGGIYLIYFSILDIVNNLDLRSSATSVLNRQIELIRNLPYESVGTEGGIPTGIIPQEQQVVLGDLTFSLKTTIRNIDDPFDGTLGGLPNDTAPADYKIVEMEVDCSECVKFVPLLFTTTVAPKNLESASTDGSIFIDIFDTLGAPVSQATVRVVNASVTPSIDLTDATNLNGVLQLVGVPTSTQNYSISVSKEGYSEDRTYSLGDPLNPNPNKPHATVAAQTVTSITFLIDRLARINVYSSDDRCRAIPNVNFDLQENKLIGTSPDVYKFSTSSVTGADGLRTLTGIEPETYSFEMTESGYDVVGTIPLTDMIVSPSSTTDFRFVLRSALPHSLSVTVKENGSEQGVANAVVNLTRSGFDQTLIAGRSEVVETNWAGGNYSSVDGEIDTETEPGTIKLAVNASSTYTVSTVNSLISNTIDFGGVGSIFYGIKWNPETQPVSTGFESLKLQLATNNDLATWNFIGPDGTSNTYYAVSSSTIWSGHDGDQYLRYKVFMSTEDELVTPELNNLTIEFTSVCVPAYQVLFNNLSVGNYDLSVTAPGYLEATSTVSISSNFEQIEVLMNHP